MRRSPFVPVTLLLLCSSLFFMGAAASAQSGSGEGSSNANESAPKKIPAKKPVTRKSPAKKNSEANRNSSKAANEPAETTDSEPQPATTSPKSNLPNPVLNFTGQEFFTAGEKNFTRYKYEVTNLDAYPNTLFAASPDLPPCGKNTNSARTWIDFFEANGKRLYGFCALTSPEKLNGIYFVLESDVLPPSFVYIEMMDRKTSTTYKSNWAETTR